MTELSDIKVGERVVRPALGVIVDGDEAVRVEPRSIEVLMALVERHRQVYPKRELIQTVWGDRFVSDEVLTHAIWDLRKAFGDRANDPSYIQTIPKRGYRLIAPVEPLAPVPSTEPSEEPPVEATESDDHVIWMGIAVLLVFLVSVAMLHSEGSGSGPADAASETLTIVPSAAPRHDAELSERLAENLRGELAGGSGLSPRRAHSCEAVGAGYCLEVRVSRLPAGHDARVELLRDGESVFATRALPYSATASPETSLAQQIAAYFEILQMPYYHDPDSQPFVDVRRHDTRAVAAFLKGMEKVYENEVGGRVQLDLATQIDPNFVAPRVIRIPWLLFEGEHETIAEHLTHLDTLLHNATPFEQELIGFARAFVHGSRAEQIRWLRGALRSAEGNRPVTYLLGTIQLESGQLAQACDTLAGLLDSGWPFPPLYTDSVSCRLRLGQLEAARAIAEQGLALDKVDPALLLMSVLLSIYDQDAERERRLHEELRRRIETIAPEAFEYDVTEHRSKLAELAERAGRLTAANQIREFAH